VRSEGEENLKKSLCGVGSTRRYEKHDDNNGGVVLLLVLMMTINEISGQVRG